MAAFSTFTYAKKYFVSQEIEFVTEKDLEFDTTYKIPEDLINLLCDNISVLDIGVFGNKVGIGTTDITAPRQELDVFGTTIVSERVGIGSIEPEQRVDVAGSIKIDENIYDSVNFAGGNGYVLSRDIIGIRWIPLVADGASPGVGFGTIVGISTTDNDGIYILDEGIFLPYGDDH